LALSLSIIAAPTRSAGQSSVAGIDTPPGDSIIPEHRIRSGEQTAHRRDFAHLNGVAIKAGENTVHARDVAAFE
jgi:hypothetical protein